MDPAQVIELNALARQKPMNEVIDRFDSPVQLFYANATVFLTGASGFIGKQLIEKLFRSCAIKKMYILMRPKKNRTIEDRLNYMLQDPLYDLLRTKQPQFADRVICVEGNVAEIRLGLSDKDWNMIAEEVNFIFHVAATVRFDEPLRKATFTNVRSTREALELARNCKNLKKFVHISTAFSFATEDRIGKDLLEQFYSCPISPHLIINMAEEIEESRLNAMTNSLLGGWPNTYTFTKSLGEELIRTTAGDLPVCIVRPPVVLPAYYEPAPGWLDIHTLQGASGIYLGAGLGIVHLFCADVNSVLAVAPLDYVNNVTIAAAWDSTERQGNGETGIFIYNIVRNMRYGFIGETIRSKRATLSTPKAVWRSELIEVKNKYIYKILAWFLHFIPAYVIDFIIFVTGKKPKEISSFVDLYTKLDKLCELYIFFSSNTWHFKDDNVKSMIKRMGDADRAIFNCDLERIDLKDYILVWGIGLRKYILKDGLKGTNQSYRKQKVLLVIKWIVLTLYASILLWICSSIYSFVKYMLF